MTIELGKLSGEVTMPQSTYPLSPQISLSGRQAERAFPWLRPLTAEQSAQFLGDLFLALAQALGQRNWHIVENLVSRWQATAQVLANSELTAALTEPIEAGEWEDWDDIENTLFDSVA